jgi:hypothetical protein
MYNKLFLTLIACLLLTAIFSGAKAQSMLIQKHDGSIHSEAISMIGNLRYATSNLVVQLVDGTTNVFALTEVKKIYFDTSIGFSDKASPELTVLPNPAIAYINVKRLNDEAGFLKIYSITGSLVHQELINSALVTIDLSAYNPGLYFVNVDGVTTKFLKQ